MLLVVRGSQAVLKCNECRCYFGAEQFWPPNGKFSAVCPDCGLEAIWTELEEPEPVIVWRRRGKAGVRGSDSKEDDNL